MQPHDNKLPAWPADVRFRPRWQQTRASANTPIGYGYTADHNFELGAPGALLHNGTGLFVLYV
jgi:hypothetical protein